MAIIGKIRDRGWLVLVFIGLALLAFIFTDWSRITGAVESKYGIGTIYGEKVDQEDFNAEFNLAEENAKAAAARNQQQYQPIDQNQFWKSYIDRKLLEREYEALGLIVSETEFDAYLYGTDGFAVLPDLAQGFTDSVTKTFNPKLLQARIEEMQNSSDPEVKKAWEESKQYYIDRRTQDKYFDILEQGIYVTSLEAKERYTASKETKNISFVVKRFGELKDEEFKPSKKELKKFYEEHKGEKRYWNREASRDIRYFSLPIVPSGDDSSQFMNQLNEFKAGLGSVSNDSAYVVKNSEFRFYTSSPFSTALPKTHPNAQQQGIYITYPHYMDTAYENAQVGDVIGPYEHEGVYMVTKVIGFTADTLNARHILVKIDQDGSNEASAQALADSLQGVLNNDNFAELAKQYSDDIGSGEKGGDLGDFFFSTMVAPFATYCADKPIGEIGQVRSQYGIHIIQVMERRGRNYPRLAVIQKTLKPSDKTLGDAKTRTYELLNKINDQLDKETDPIKRVALFDTIANKEGYFSRPINMKENDPQLFGFTTNYAEDAILKLAFAENAMVGDITQLPVKDKDKNVIAVIASIREKGEPTFEDAKLMMERDLIMEKKTEKLTNELNGKKLADLKGNGLNVQEAEVTFGNPQITGSGFEPKVIGAIFSGLRDGEQSKPIKGETGVFIVRVNKTTKAPVVMDYNAEKTSMIEAARGSFQNEVKRSLTKAADVVNNRRLYNLRVRY